ncbi:MAG TPA: hypothetical protein DEH78_06660 [Solibacterales bacterium]|nr:hypothetical protein [Bryobacterales bacterium]
MVAALLLLQAAATLTTHKHASGLAARVPSDWTVESQAQGLLLKPPGAAFDPRRQDNAEVYFATSEPGYDPEEEREFVSQIASGFLQSGAIVTRNAERAAFAAGASYTWEFRHPATGRPFSVRLYIRPEPPRAHAILAMGDAARLAARDEQVRSLLSGLKFEEPRIDTRLADDHPLAQMWLERLRGKTLAGRTTRHLAEDGVITIGPNPAIAAPAGKWRIRAINGFAFLEITPPQGDPKLLSLEQTPAGLLVDGSPVTKIY